MYSSSAINLRGHQGPQERRNSIINGDFNICQRGEFTVDPYVFTFGEATLGSTFDYTLDRWRFYMIGATQGFQPELSIERMEHELDGPSGFTPLSNHFLRVQTSGTGASLSNLYDPTNLSTGLTTEAYLEQRIENVKTLAGKSATLSFKAKFLTVSGSSRVVGASLVQVFGTGAGNHSTDVRLAGGTFALSSSWTKFSHTFSVPDLEGKVLGFTGDRVPTGAGDTASSYLAMRMYLQAGTGGTGSDNPAAPSVFGWNTGATEAIDISQVQLEAGEQSTDFEQRDIADDIRDCKRYFETIRAYVSTDGPLGNVKSKNTKLILMDEKRNKYWASKLVYGNWRTIDSTRGVSLLETLPDSFILQITPSNTLGVNLIASLGTDHNPGGGAVGSDKGDGEIEGNIWVTVNAEL
jgi:hypothetical protein|tara:strand:- start:237 stop:1460 length:1224 start_codon:yes stop_codon:yes gene_type:complete